MPVESWINPDETPDMAASATAMIDAALTGSGLAREAYWAAVRKGYNTPYNDPPRKASPVAAAAISVSDEAVPVAVLAAVAAAEIRAA